MKLYRKELKKYDDGSIRSVYNFEKIEKIDDLKRFMLAIQNKFGTLNNIIVKNETSDNKILLYKKYKNLKEFCKDYQYENFEKFNIYEFLGVNLHFKIDITNNFIDIYQKKSDLLNQNDIDNYSYYLFENGLIVRYDKNNSNCSYLNEDNIWVEDNSLIPLICNPNYDYEEIDDPLEKKNYN